MNYGLHYESSHPLYENLVYPIEHNTNVLSDSIENRVSMFSQLEPRDIIDTVDTARFPTPPSELISAKYPLDPNPSNSDSKTKPVNVTTEQLKKYEPTIDL